MNIHYIRCICEFDSHNLSVPDNLSLFLMRVFTVAIRCNEIQFINGTVAKIMQRDRRLLGTNWTQCKNLMKTFHAWLMQVNQHVRHITLAICFVYIWILFLFTSGRFETIFDFIFYYIEFYYTNFQNNFKYISIYCIKFILFLIL